MSDVDVVFVPGDDEQFRGQACISSETRPFSRHIWFRAISHISHMLDVPHDVRNTSISYCLWVMRQMPADDPTKKTKPPQFSWRGIPGKL